MRMKTGQTVQIMTGRDKGKKGKIIQMLPAESRLVVDGVNKMFKHLKQRAGKTRGGRANKGERMEFFGPIHMSNVKLVEDVAPAAEKPKKDAAKKSA